MNPHIQDVDVWLYLILCFALNFVTFSLQQEFYCSPLYGGPGGNYYDDRTYSGGGNYCDDGTYSGIRRITLTADDKSLTSVQMYYGLEGNENLIDRIFPGHCHGSKVGEVIEYNLNYPQEIVTKISGYIGISGVLVTSLTFHTNQRKLGPCGQEEGTYFETQTKMRGKIVGVFGSSGSRVDSIGMYMRKPRPSKYEEFYCSHLYGGHGNYWTDGTYSGIRRITITANQYAITSIQLHYGLDGDESLTDRSFSGGQHGGWIGNPHQGALGDRMEYSLNYPEQIITKISGHFGSYKPWPESWVVIKSLTFHTNKGKYGPCGQERGTHFETEEGGKIVGFFGSSGSLVDSIGVYMLKPRASIEEASESRENKDDRIISSSLEKLASR